MAEIIVNLGFEGEGKTVLQAVDGESIFQTLRKNGLMVESACGGVGTCGKCKVRVLTACDGITREEQELLQEAELDQGIRLACCLQASEGVILELPQVGDMEIFTTDLGSQIALKPLVEKRLVKLPTPNLSDQRDLVTRLLEQETLKGIRPACLRDLAEMGYGSPCTLTIFSGEVRAVSSPEGDGLYGVAFDLGTTTIVAYLMDLTSGEELQVLSRANPQRHYGADVISRIQYTATHRKGRQDLQDCLIEVLNSLIENLCSKAKLSSEAIQIVTIAANTVMLHSLVGVSAQSIAKAPFAPVFVDTTYLEPKDLGLTLAPEGQVILLPSVSGYVGADIIGDLLACNFSRDPNWQGLLIDIGTNGEVVLGNRLQAYACSAAAGPAFEGANITLGMPAVPGAISTFRLKDNKAYYDVIGGGQPLGLCGSGLISVVAELVGHHFLDASGAFRSLDELAGWQRTMMTRYGDMPAFIVAQGNEAGPEIVVTQKDIREVQLAKGAIKAGVMTLLKVAGLQVEELNQVYLAGGFGNHIAVEHACLLGLIPAELEGKVIRIGNGAGLGAKLCLLNGEYLELAKNLGRDIHYVELSSHPDFQTFFMDAMFF